MRCPTCHINFTPSTSASKPFCSEKCRSIDLGRWLNEDNRLPHIPNIEDDEKPADDWSGVHSEAAEEEAG
ncbi:MAG: DNA gyrase inhibitor YacG [Pirellulales bacterium]|nr:DNA gyrase inhibitor YacG [Pirellulales bacterium]HCK42342.1 DNA gyrase inhibitor YacG [Planctomycetaceae bacterium]